MWRTMNTGQSWGLGSSTLRRTSKPDLMRTSIIIISTINDICEICDRLFVWDNISAQHTYQISTLTCNWSGRLAKCRLAVISHAAHNSWRGTQLQTCKHGYLWCLQLGLKSGIYACLVGGSCTHQASFDNTCICINSQVLVYTCGGTVLPCIVIIPHYTPRIQGDTWS